jgi:hypothetical protein
LHKVNRILRKFRLKFLTIQSLWFKVLKLLING